MVHVSHVTGVSVGVELGCLKVVDDSGGAVEAEGQSLRRWSLRRVQQGSYYQQLGQKQVPSGCMILMIHTGDIECF